MSTASELYDALVATGYPMDNHESDLYVLAHPETTPIVKQYEYFTSNVRVFRSQLDGRMWYEIPFAYMPFWTRHNAAN